jgi:Fic-DOC domain mobile mystery protein B
LSFKFQYPNGATPLDLNEIEGLRHPNIKSQAELNDLEAANIIEGIQWLRRLRRPDVFSDHFATMLHKRLFGGVWTWAGTFRKTGKNVGIMPVQIQIELAQLLDDAKYWHAHQSFHPVELAVRVHHKLTYIHPFPNGNGRHARIFAETMLKVTSPTFHLTWGDEETLREGLHRQTYIKSLKFADAGNYIPLLNFVGHKL